LQLATSAKETAATQTATERSVWNGMHTSLKNRSLSHFFVRLAGPKTLRGRWGRETQGFHPHPHLDAHFGWRVCVCVCARVKFLL
jgi:hypothetical protein